MLSSHEQEFRLTTFPCKQLYTLEKREPSFTPAGGVLVLANILHHTVHSNLIDARNHLAAAYHDWDGGAEFDTLTNSLLVSAIFGMGSFLDSLAALCQDIFFEGSARVNFANYGFLNTNLRGMEKKKESICRYRFGGLSFGKLWNKCKHEQPWLGHVSICTRGNYADICDSDNVAVLRDVLVPIFYDAQEMLLILAKTQRVTLKRHSI